MEYKQSLLDERYRFCLDDLSSIEDKSVSNKITEMLEIKRDGIVYTLSKDWLVLATHYEVAMPMKDALKINFVECRSRVLGFKCGHLMTIQPPIDLEDGYRVIPGFVGFGISKDGKVRSLRTGRILSQKIGPYGYPYVNLYDADKSKWRSVSTHILLARAYVPNSDPTGRCFINHKDGNKTNYQLNNLEWVSSTRNNTHAVEAGLRFDNLPCRMLDTTTGEITKFPSVSQAFRTIGLISTSKRICKRVGNSSISSLFLNRYEIKLNTDSSDWQHSDRTVDKREKQSGPYQALRIKDGKVFVEDTLRKLSERTGVSIERIRTAILAIVPTSTQGHAFRMLTTEEWPDKFKEIVSTPPRIIEFTNPNTSEVRVFRGMRAATKAMLIDKRTLKNKLLNGKLHNGWLIKENSCDSPNS